MKKTKIILDEYETGIMIRALIELRNTLLREGRFSDAVDELIIKLAEK